MPKRLPVPEGLAEKLKQTIRRTGSAHELRQALCLWLRLGLGLNTDQIATALGYAPAYVGEVQARFLHEGKAALGGPGRGGRRHSILTGEQEAALLRRLRLEAFPNGVLEYRAVHRAVEKEAGRKVAASTVTRLLTRHGWVRQALVVSTGHSPALNPGRGALRKSGAWEPLQPEAGERGSWAAPVKHEPSQATAEPPGAPFASSPRDPHEQLE